jgi:hypothetical protein
MVLWGFLVSLIGGALPRDPPFWPRIVIAFIPAIVLVAVVLDGLYRGASGALGRAGRAFALAGLAAFVGLAVFLNVKLYSKYCLGIPANGTQVSTGTQWTQGIMGRDVQRWGQSAMIYIVSRSAMDFTCGHPTMEFYAYDADVCDAREIGRYLPFKDRRTIVCYFLPETTDEIEAVREIYRDAEAKPFFNNLGDRVFTRLVIPRPHAWNAVPATARARVGRQTSRMQGGPWRLKEDLRSEGETRRDVERPLQAIR